MSADGAGGDGGPKQRFELYIKASAIDKETKGSCPICQHWFMITCLLGETQQDIDFKVYTVQADCPPKNFGVEQGWSKKFPVVMVLEGRDKKGQDLTGTKYDTFEELEIFFESINKECPQLKRKNGPNMAAMKAVESVYNAFNTSLSAGQPNKKLLAELKKINEFLEEDYSENMYLVDDELSFADCYLLPRLQHIRVAGKEYMDFDIPAENLAIWRYLMNAYQTEAFRSTMPSDQDIVFHYEKKASNALARKKRRPRPTLQNFTYSLDIPEDIATALQATTPDAPAPPPADDASAAGANGEVTQEESQAPVEQMSTMEVTPQDQRQEEEEQEVVQIQAEAESQETAAVDAEAAQDDRSITPPSPPPPAPADDPDYNEVVTEQTTTTTTASEEEATVTSSSTSAPVENDAGGSSSSCEVPEDAAYENVTVEAAPEVNSAPPPPPPPEADYETSGGGGDTVSEKVDGGQEEEPNYVNLDAVRDGGDVNPAADQEEPTVNSQSAETQQEQEKDEVQVTVVSEGEVKSEVGNGAVVKEKEEDTVIKAGEGDGVAVGAGSVE